MPFSALAVLLILRAGFIRPMDLGCESRCQCIYASSAREALARADFVFVGTAVGARDTFIPTAVPRRLIRFTFIVHAGWKGPAVDSVEVLTGLGGGDCGYPFGGEEPFLVFAHKTPDGLMSTWCNLNNPLDEARRDLKALGAPVFGRVPRR